MLAFDGVTRVFRDGGTRRAALDGVTFRLEPGTLTALVGDNGAGKSTLLRIAATLDAPTSGRASVAGVEGAEARRRIGYLGQDAGLHDALTLREDLRFFASFWGREAEVAPLASRLALRLDVPARLLSRGERQRGVLARALLAGEMVLLDEPTTALDADGRARLMALLDEARGARTVLVATHDDALVAKSDRVLRLKEGRLA